MTSTEPKVPAERLMSLDALRGFDMFWIMGGEHILAGLSVLTGWTWLQQRVVPQLNHVQWNGFKAYDLIFPLFLFLAGVAMPFSLGRRMSQGTAKWKLALKVVRRGLLLILLGLIYSGLLDKGFSAHLRWPSVLGRIGLAYLLAGLIYLVVGVRGQIVSVVVLLLGYWAAMMLIPVPGIGAGVLEPGYTLADYVDRKCMSGHLYITDRHEHGLAIRDRDPEGLLSTVPAIATALLGALVGRWLQRGQPSGTVKSVTLIIAGLAALGVGGVWNRWFPINKNLWSSSFVLWTAGWSLLLLAVFFQIIDVWKLRRWAFFFVVIGMNAITIYMADRFINFGGIAELIFVRHTINKHLTSVLVVAVEWFFLFLLYRNRWFLRV